MKLGNLGRALGITATKSSILEQPVPQADYYGNISMSGTLFSEVMRVSPAAMYRRQPHLRTVVSFMARNIAQLGLHSFDRVADNDRRRNTDDVTAKLFRRPNPYDTGYELVYGLVADLALNDRTYWHVTPADSLSGWQIIPIKAAWVQAVKGGNAYQPEFYQVQTSNGRSIDIPAVEVIAFNGWNPTQATGGVSPVDTLKEVLLEQIHALKYRNQVWEKGGRVGSVITRPAGPVWTQEQEGRFMRAFRAGYSGDGSEAGSALILQDGMTMNRLGFSAKEDDYVEGTKLALATVASVYHINPSMVGLLENANYSNAREFRKGLFGETLGPVIQMIEARLNTFLLPMINASPNTYLEFNVAEKLKGDFETRAALTSTAVGAPWMTVNEARALDNRPPIEGGDVLRSPLNMTAATDVIEGEQ